jgi:hypothetical protein
MEWNAFSLLKNKSWVYFLLFSYCWFGGMMFSYGWFRGKKTGFFIYLFLEWRGWASNFYDDLWLSTEPIQFYRLRFVLWRHPPVIDYNMGICYWIFNCYLHYSVLSFMADGWIRSIMMILLMVTAWLSPRSQLVFQELH